MMYNHLKEGTPLPPSQVVRAEARGTNPYTVDNIEDWPQLPNPDAGSDAITFSKGVLEIPR
jgi:hydroxybutyrate-dimer hydrolase